MQLQHFVATTEVKSSTLCIAALGRQMRVQAVPAAHFWDAQTVEPRLCAIRRNAGAGRTTFSSLVRPDIRSKLFASVVVNTRAFGQKLWHLYVHFVRPSPIGKARSQGSSFVPSARFGFRPTPSVLSFRAHATNAVSVRARAAA
jgi:hypothetical protein